MATKLIPVFVYAVCIASSTCYGDTTVNRRHYSPIQYLKNYALSSCIADGYQSKGAVNDAIATANGYKELGSLDIEAYNKAAILGREFLARKYMSQSGEKLVLMKCIDFYHSKELNILARKYAKRK
jgi:hypothetical protein